jgi:predicted ATP-grasp superfamily ATP-dependent carboligase
MGHGRNTTRSVVVPAVSAPSSVACLRSLGPRDVHTIVVSEEETPAAFQSKYCDEAVPVPSPHEDLVAYKDALFSLAMRPDVVTIVPVREEDVYVLSKYRDEFREHVATPWPPLGTLARVQDRVRLFDAAESAGVPAPRTRLLESSADWDRRWIVKSRYSILADEYVEGYPPERCVDPPRTDYLRPGVAPDVERIRTEMRHTPILQEYVPTNHEYGFFALYDRGEAVATFQHRQLRGYSYAGGASAFRESVDLPALEEAGRALLDHLDWHGLAMVEFLRNDTADEFELMEINPRFWSSLPFSVQAGADFPYYYWLLANDRCAEISCEYRTGLAGHLLRGELLYLRSVLTEEIELVDRPSASDAVREVARSIVAHPRFDYLSLDDPWPFLRDLLNAYEEARTRRLRSFRR